MVAGKVRIVDLAEDGEMVRVRLAGFYDPSGAEIARGESFFHEESDASKERAKVPVADIVVVVDNRAAIEALPIGASKVMMLVAPDEYEQLMGAESSSDDALKAQVVDLQAQLDKLQADKSASDTAASDAEADEAAAKSQVVALQDQVDAAAKKAEEDAATIADLKAQLEAAAASAAPAETADASAAAKV